MSYVAIGTPGQSPRIIMSVMTDADTARQLASGEVAIPTLTVGQFVISADGKSLTAYVAPLDDQKNARWLDARNYRDQIANGSCSTPSGIVQTDDASKLRINGAVAMAMLSKSAGTASSIAWTLNDNSVVMLDADAMIAVGVAVGTFVANCQNNGTAIRAQIDAATDAASLAAIDITAGYPS